MNNEKGLSKDVRELFIINRLQMERHVFLGQKLRAGRKNYCEALWPGLYKRSMHTIILVSPENN